MKTQSQFKNASLLSVVNSSIVVKDSTGREHTFANASVVSVNNGTIIIESEWKPKNGELVKAIGCHIDCYIVFQYMDDMFLYTHGAKGLGDTYVYLSPETWAYNEQLEILPVTPEEQKEFDDFCKSQGKIWNKETLQWEKYRWKPRQGEKYYFINLFPIDEPIKSHKWVDDHIDNGYYKTNNCFKTEEEAEAKLGKIKKLLLEV